MHNLTIRAKGKALLESTVLTVSQGRRYGLVGPNGKGKSTLLRMVARRQVPVPDSLDVLLVEQVRCWGRAQCALLTPIHRTALGSTLISSLVCWIPTQGKIPAAAQLCAAVVLCCCGCRPLS